MNPPRHRRLNEAEILALFRRRLGVGEPTQWNLAGTTDDAAIVPLARLRQGPGRRRSRADALVATQDGLIEGVHFRLDYFTPGEALTRCLTTNLSDLAAMGAEPVGALVNLGLAQGQNRENFVVELADALRAAMRRYHFTVFGGDVIRAPALTISVTMLGRLVAARALLRSGTRVGDAVYLSGSVGAASLGLKVSEAARRRKRPKPGERPQDYPASVKRLTNPRPRLKLGRLLAEEALATSCIDLSDSLSKSLLLIAEASGVGMRLAFQQRWLHPEVRRFYRGRSPRELAEVALAAEEDLELLFTVPRRKESKLMELAPRGLIHLGEVAERKRGVTVQADDLSIAVTETGFEHF